MMFVFIFFSSTELFGVRGEISVDLLNKSEFSEKVIKLHPAISRDNTDYSGGYQTLQVTPSTVYVGDYSLICQNDEGTYNPNMENFVYSPEIVLPSGNQVDADFMVRGAIIDYDEFPNVDYWGVQVSPDSGVNWYYISNPYGVHDTNFVYVDTPDMWASFNERYNTPIDLDNYAGMTIQFRWFFHSDRDAIHAEAEGLWIDDFVVHVDGAEVFFEDFEDGIMGNWVSEDQTATPAMWHQSTVNAYGGQSWRMADPDLGTNGGYLDHWYQVLDTPPVTLPNSGEMNLTFMQRRAIEKICTFNCPACSGPTNFDGWDAFNVRISNDGGASWEVLTPSSPQYNTDVTYSFGFEFDEGCDIPGWGGPETNPTWTSTTVPIPSSYHGEEVMIRFAFASDPNYSTTDNTELTGVWIDNIDVAGVFTNDGEDTTGFNAQSLVSIGGDLWHVAYTAEEPQYPFPANLVAVAGDQLVSLTWDPIGGSEGGEIVYDNDDGSGSIFTNGIYAQSGTFVVGEYFDTPFGAEVTSVKIFGYSNNYGSQTTIKGYSATGGLINATPDFQKDIILSAGTWNEYDLSPDGWEFTSDFVIGFDVGSFGSPLDTIYAALDESAVPSTNSYADLGGWSTWQSNAQAYNFPDGEWGIRAIIAASGEVSVVYNIYRHTVGQDYGDPLSYGSAWPDNKFDDPFVMNGTTYWYVVTAVYNYGNEDEAESPFSDEVEVMPQATTVYEISYDDGTAETGVTLLGDGGFYAVRFTPDDYPIQILKVKYYATGAGGLTWVKLFKDDGENGMPGTQLGTDLLFTSIIEGWNEKDVSAGNISVDGGSFYVVWGESGISTQLGLDTDAPVEGNSYFQIPGSPWAPISDLGYNGDLMIRAVVDAVASITPMQLSQLPSMFSLKQNYPNPFNPITFIPFELPKDTHVSLEIYDLKGRIVRELVSEWLPAGRYQYPLDGSDLATGIYIYRLSADGFTMTKKMILLK